MNLQDNHFVQLANQVRTGDLRTRARLLGEMQPLVERMLEHALAPEAPTCRVHRQLRTLSRQLSSGPCDQPAERRRLAEAICRRVANRLAPLGTEAFEHTLFAEVA